MFYSEEVTNVWRKAQSLFFSKHPCIFGGEFFAEGDTFHLNFEKQKRIIAVNKSNTLKQTVHDEPKSLYCNF